MQTPLQSKYPHCVLRLLRSCSLQPPAEKPETSEQSLSEIEMETFPFSVSGNYTIIVGGPRAMVSECVVQGVGSKRKKKDWEEQDCTLYRM